MLVAVVDHQVGVQIQVLRFAALHRHLMASCQAGNDQFDDFVRSIQFVQEAPLGLGRTVLRLDDRFGDLVHLLERRHYPLVLQAARPCAVTLLYSCELKREE